MTFTDYRAIILILLLGLSSCDAEEEGSVLDLSYWIGEYEINTIEGQNVDCEIIYLLPEKIIINRKSEFSVVSLCDGRVMVQGVYEFKQGLFNLYVDHLIQEPEDTPEFEMQIFEDELGNVRIYRCSALSGACSLRLGTRK